MDFAFTAEQRAMAGTVRDIVAATPDTAEPWAAITGIGLPGLLVPEELGGLGLGMVEGIAAVEELGRRATRFPWVAAVITGPLLATAVPELLPDVLTGAHRLGCAHAGLVLDADLVSSVLVVDGHRLGVVPAAAAAPFARRDLLGRPRWWTVSATAWTDLPAGTAVDALACARTATAAYLIGTGAAALALAVEHARTREQFGVAIGSFQAVKHQLADAHTALAMARPLVAGAAVARDTGIGSAGRDACVAVLAAGAAAERAARVALQVHGAIGYTDECAVGALLAQVLVAAPAWGSESALRDELARAMATEGRLVPVGGAGRD
ncbi:acyl-CoA dehydrogenase family protein [Dactylosporangium roseum]|uniref:Acyl-CoA dehydrogenase family protein n=1 Tax=Dactylosporangium roseum TaxID=47989 RepID=A0ABY5YXD4_9ACTN|nr:acyl-CoA dehydrogenase [Dactylosporangium roseum]UWZ34404.1 acyl-CoA dehydrogenase family protein [Dactylosporangium roseum]